MSISKHCLDGGNRRVKHPSELTKEEVEFLEHTLSQIRELKFSIMPLENKVLGDLYDSYLCARAHDSEMRSFEKYLYMRLNRFEGDDD